MRSRLLVSELSAQRRFPLRGRRHRRHSHSANAFLPIFVTPDGINVGRSGTIAVIPENDGSIVLFGICPGVILVSYHYNCRCRKATAAKPIRGFSHRLKNHRRKTHAVRSKTPPLRTFLHWDYGVASGSVVRCSCSAHSPCAECS